MLEISDLSVSYGEIRALTDVSLDVDKNEVVTVIGSNGAGKTTLLRAASNLIEKSSGEILYKGTDLASMSPDDIVRSGLVHVPEERQIFPDLTVRENLMMGAFSRSEKDDVDRDLDVVFSLFPRLKERTSQRGETLSGGEQQMLAIGRGLMSDPELLLLDEPSLGLAPQLVEEIESTVVELSDQGITILLVEQNANLALDISDRAYILQNGRVQLSGSAAELAKKDQVREAYLGL